MVENDGARTGRSLIESKDVFHELNAPKEFIKTGTENPADDWPHNRDPGVGPVRVAFSGNGQKKVSQARPEIARWINRIASRSPQGQTNGPDQHAEQEGAEAFFEP